MFRRIYHFFRGLAAGLIVSLLFTACAPSNIPAGSPSATAGALLSGQLTPYHASTATPALPPTLAETPTPLPSATPTPLSHVVKKGEDFGGIAYLYHVTVPDLVAANPKVNPRAMSVGTVLVIPPSKTKMPPATANPSAPPPSLTPIPVESGSMHCAPDQSGGVWCFMPVRNTQDFTLEGVSAIFQLSGAGGGTPVTQNAYIPLDLLPPGETLPLAAYFPPQQVQSLSAPFKARSDPLTALASADNGRYEPTQMDHQKVMISADGLSAAVSLEVRLKSADAKARRLWVAVVAYDAQGQVTGMRRWENASGQVLQNNAALNVTVNVYSVDHPIAKVSLMAEARP